MSNKLHLDLRNSSFPMFFVCFQDTYHPKGVVTCQSPYSYFPLSAYGPLLLVTCVISCPLAPALISLFIDSYLPAVIILLVEFFSFPKVLTFLLYLFSLQLVKTIKHFCLMVS